MKNERQYNDSALFTFIGFVAILLLILITLANSCNQPINDNEIDIEMDCGDDPIIDSSLLDCGDYPIIDSSLLDCGKSDEYLMWIGDNGDTIWE